MEPCARRDVTLRTKTDRGGAKLHPTNITSVVMPSQAPALSPSIRVVEQRDGWTWEGDVWGKMGRGGIVGEVGETAAWDEIRPSRWVQGYRRASVGL